MKGMKNTERHKQHGFMLFLACVLSFTAFLFAVDFPTVDDNPARLHPVSTVARQVEGSPAKPVRQQSTPSPQPMRAILIEAIAAKMKAAHLDSSGAALPVKVAAVFPPTTSSALATQKFQHLAVMRRHFGSARAPPKAA